MRTGAAEPTRHGAPAAGALLRAGEAGRGPRAAGNHAGAQRPVPGAGRHGLCADYGPQLRELQTLSVQVDPPALREGGSAPRGGQWRAGPRRLHLRRLYGAGLHRRAAARPGAHCPGQQREPVDPQESDHAHGKALDTEKRQLTGNDLETGDIL